MNYVLNNIKKSVKIIKWLDYIDQIQRMYLTYPEGNSCIDNRQEPEDAQKSIKPAHQ